MNTPQKTYNFESSASVADVISKLSLATKEKTGGFDKSVLRGSASDHRFYLYRHSPLFGNIFKPVFTGELIERNNGGSKIEGKFTMYWVGKVAFTLWLTVAILFCALLLVSQVLEGWTVFIQASITAALFLTGAFIVLKFTMWLSEKDKKFITSTIENLLTD